jgi:hypothetical protein
MGALRDASRNLHGTPSLIWHPVDTDGDIHES